MENISIADRLLFFKTERYIYEKHHVFDVSGAPRPHFCMGLILSGKGIFRDAADGHRVTVSAGDIIFVPIGSRYVSEWEGEPCAEYISMHFIFGTPAAVSREQNFKLQSITLPDIASVRADFETALAGSTGGGTAHLAALGALYRVLAAVLPRLTSGERTHMDERIRRAIAYIEENAARPITVEALAAAAQMSLPRFYPAFKEATGVTPIAYVNHIRVRRAILLMTGNDADSIEKISDAAGFESAAYFRRVFRAATGKTPSEYRKSAIEL